MADEASLLGIGITYPWVLTKGKIAFETGIPLIRSSIKLILKWDYPRRFFLGEFDSRIHELLEEPNDPILLDLCETMVMKAIAQWERRVHLESVTIEKTSDSSVNLRLKYTIITTQQTDTFVFPYYKQIIY